MSFRNWQQRLHTRLGEKIFLSAQRDFLTSEDIPASGLYWPTTVVSCLVLALPLALIVPGAVLIWWSFGYWLPMVMGGILVLCGLAIFPRPNRFDGRLYGRADLPRLFALCDQISETMQAGRVDAIHLNDQLNAWIRTSRAKGTILGLGLPLWVALDPKERVALLAHELAHQINKDPARSTLPRLAIQSIERWTYFLSPVYDLQDDQIYADRGLIEAIVDTIYAMVRLLLDLIRYAIERLMFLQSQRSEYLADAMGARVAGRAPFVQLLEKTPLFDLAELELSRAYPTKGARGTDLLAKMAVAINQPDPADRAKLTARMQQEKSCIDTSHPPTVYRLAFLASVDLPWDSAQDFDRLIARADQELAPLIEEIGQALLQDRVRQ